MELTVTWRELWTHKEGVEVTEDKGIQEQMIKGVLKLWGRNVKWDPGRTGKFWKEMNLNHVHIGFLDSLTQNLSAT